MDARGNGARESAAPAAPADPGPYAGLRVGVLALQGAFAEHAAALRRLGAEAREVRLPRDLDGLDALILPGGESTAIGRLLEDFALLEPLRRAVVDGLPAYGTCAGAILLADDVVGLERPLVGGLEARVERNAFGRQLQSFEADLHVPVLGEEPFPAIFIRAPAIRATGRAVEPLAALADGTVVAARRDHVLVSCFHPELSGDDRFHRLFLDGVLARRRARRTGRAAGARP